MKSLLLIVCGMLPLQAQLIAEFRAGESMDRRLDRVPALWLKEGEPATAFLPSSAFDTTWRGKLNLASRQRLIFSFEGEGEARLEINGEELLAEQGTLGTARSEQKRLNAGEHDIVIRYRSLPDGTARFRLFWEEKSFPRQSVPPTAFTCEPDDETKAALQRRRGRELFATQHCAKCHQSETLPGTDPMQEMQEIAPLIVTPGDRLNEAWLRAWLTEPHTLRPGTTMPQLFDPKNPDSAQQIADVAAFLMSMKSATTAEQPASTDDATVLAGGATFHKLGCIACHTNPEQNANDPDGKRIPLHHVATKFQPGALAAFLKAPNAYAPHRGMPDFKLNDEETRNLSAYLTAKAKAPLPATSTLLGDAARGKAIAAAQHCYACHAGLPAPETFTTPCMRNIFAVNWNERGCVAPDAKRGKSPALHLTESDRLALIAFAATGSHSLALNDKAEAAERKFHSLRCDACHSRDGLPALLDGIHSQTAPLTAHIPGANEILDQSRPHLTFLGEMLQPSYTVAMIAGTLPHKTRPWLQMRMPAYSAHAAGIADGFARIHGIDPTEKTNHTADAALVAIGKDLVSADKGFGCTTCHGLGDTAPTAAFEVQGIAFEHSATRLRREWYVRWMDNPASVTPATKMPRYAPDGASPNPALDGNAAAQFDAIWQYLQSVK
jgi:mono/diheme cytochrome c family protein